MATITQRQQPHLGTGGAELSRPLPIWATVAIIWDAATYRRGSSSQRLPSRSCTSVSWCLTSPPPGSDRCICIAWKRRSRSNCHPVMQNHSSTPTLGSFIVRQLHATSSRPNDLRPYHLHFLRHRQPHDDWIYSSGSDHRPWTGLKIAVAAAYGLMEGIEVLGFLVPLVHSRFRYDPSETV